MATPITRHDFASTLDELRELISHPTTRNWEIEEKLGKLQNIVQQREHEDLSAPVECWDDVKIRLRQMKRASKQGSFDDDLKDACKTLNAFLSQAEPREDPEYWKARTILYELNDMFLLDPEINHRAFEDGVSTLQELQKLEKEGRHKAAISESARKLIREKVLFCSCRANEMRRRGETNNAGKLFSWLLHFTQELKTEQTPCFGTQAYLSYHLASIFRILEQHDDAEVVYTDALNLYHERAKSRSFDDHDDFFFSTRRIAMCIGLGFGWLNLTRGYLHRAENALTTARSLLARIPDSLIAHSIEMLYGILKRCRAGTNEQKLKDAIDSLKNAHDAFKKLGHVRYQARAAWELALAFTLIRRFDEANRYLKFIEDFAKLEGNRKWQANLHIQRSRIKRSQGHYQEALAEAQTALDFAREWEQTLPSVDALITRGEAYFYQAEATNQESKYSQARADFQKALDTSQRRKTENADDSRIFNPKISAVCELRIAQCYAREGLENEAKTHFEKWKVLRESVEHEWVRELAREVRAEIRKLQENFTISSKDPTKWNMNDRVAEMKQWLLTQALRHTEGNRTAAAKLIGVSPTALLLWQRNPEQRVKRARGVRRKK